MEVNEPEVAVLGAAMSYGGESLVNSSHLDL